MIFIIILLIVAVTILNILSKAGTEDTHHDSHPDSYYQQSHKREKK